MRKGFTLLEMLLVIVIIGVLVSIALPNYTNMVEKARADQAITYLKLIRTGEKIYYASNTTYVECANASEIKSYLGVEVTEENYLFSVTDVILPDQFLARAERKTDNTTITLNQDGVFGGSSQYKP